MRKSALWAVALVAVGSSLVRADDTKKYEVEVRKDVPYYTGAGASKERHVLDIYLPKGAKGYPVLFFIHGGGWTGGSKNGFAAHGQLFAGMGIGFVATNYRLSPGVKHPEHIKDVARAFAWAQANLARDGADVRRFFVSGHSAGGHLAALLATDDSYLKEHKLGLDAIRGVIPVSGVFTISSRMERQFGDAAACKAASPMTHVRENLPPMLVLYGDKEENGLGKQANEFSAALQKAKVDARVESIKDRDHGTVMRNISKEDDPATRLILAFIAKHGGK
jgi:acetyl esterase/lipase